MNSLICGSGFGLYGYLPAIYKFSSKIYLNKKYKILYNLRNELTKYESKIIWYENINNLIHKIDYLIIAKRPKDQLRIIKSLLKKHNNIKHFFLEKPIALNPKKSLELLKIFNKKKINYSFGFLFEYVNWTKLINNKIKKKNQNKITIKWNIKKNLNISTSWKYNFNNGGGILRYYGIHFIKLFSDLNFNNITKNVLKKDYWEFKIKDEKNNSIRLLLKYSNISNFSYKINNRKLTKIHSPFFDKIDHKLIDPRCFFLKKYIRKNLFNYNDNFFNMKKFINLWHTIEINKK
tara:strand:+ start:815 stop:1687 length:873 start_codon:yes stop_codon:yes gene_type:complete